MTQPESQAPAGGSRPENPPNTPPVQKIQGRGITDQYLAQQPNGATPGNPDEPKLVTGRIRVKWDGVDRDVDVDDLVTQARTSQEALARAQALQDAARQQVVRGEALRALGERLEKLPSEHRAALQSFLDNPDGFVKREQRQLPPDDPFAMPPTPAQPDPAQTALAQRLGQLESSVQTVAQFLTQIGTERQAQTLAQQVEREMAERPIFRVADPSVTNMARSFVLTRLAQNPESNVSDLVTDAGRLAQEIHQGYRPAGLASQRAASADQKPRFTGEDLMSGKIRAAAQEALRQHGLT